jgi:hypothetical protein
MKHRLPLAILAVTALCALLVAGAGANHGRRAHHGQNQQQRGQVFTYGGQLLAAPGANATSASVAIQTGNRAALKTLIGASENEVFALNSSTEVLLGSHGVPHVGSTADLQSGDYVTLKIHAPAGSSLQTILSRPASTVSDTAAPGGNQPLWLFIGTVAGGQAGGHVSLSVDSGNWKALHAMLGQPLGQTFTYDTGTIFLLWQGNVPTVIDPSQLKAGDRITVRIRAARDASLAQVEATPANHVGDHEPAPAPEA